MTAWILLFAVQTWLVSTKRVKLHMKLGWVGVGLAILVLATGYTVPIGALEHKTAADRGGIPPLPFLVGPLADLVPSGNAAVVAVRFADRVDHCRACLCHVAIWQGQPSVPRRFDRTDRVVPDSYHDRRHRDLDAVRAVADLLK